MRLMLCIFAVGAFGLAPGLCGGEIGLVNMADVMKANTQFNDTMAALKKETKDAEQEFRGRRVELKLLGDQLKKDTSDQDERKAQVERLASRLNSDIAASRNEFLRREAELYADTYERAIKAIEQVADAHHINLVLRFHGDEEIDRTTPSAVLKHLNRHVLFQRNLDLTQLVIKQLESPSENVDADSQKPRKRRRPQGRTLHRKKDAKSESKESNEVQPSTP